MLKATRPNLRRAILAITVLLMAPNAMRAGEALSKEDRAREAAKRVDAALAAELAGDAATRRALLASALEVDPDNAAARWQNGEVYFDGAWRPVESIGAHVADDWRWEEYARLRKSTPQTPQGHLALARWCRKNRLAAEARYHWLHVLAANPNHEEAQRRLDLRPFRGGLYTNEQIAAFKAGAKQSQENLDRYKPLFLQYRREAESGEPTERAAALVKLSSVSDPDAIEALEEVLDIGTTHQLKLAARLGKEEAERLADDFKMAYIAALGNMPEHVATVRLVNCAVYAEDPSIREAAARALKPREPTSYIPMLMSGLAAPIDARIDLHVALDGSLTVYEKLYQDGFDAGREHEHVDTFKTKVIRFRNVEPWRRRQGDLRIFARDYRRAVRQAAATSAQVDAANAQARWLNERIVPVLETTTGKSLGADPEAWWESWQAYNELYYPEDKSVSQSYTYERHYREVVTPSCFIAGTPVWTQLGPVPIESISPGDMVLSQEVSSGELAFKPVLKTTTRPPSETVHITLPSETITATRGHRFWRTGDGWRMAKNLQPGASLRAVDGSVAIQTMRDGEESIAYNLVVGEFNTYFVGEARLLVHDNSCPRPTLAPTPGMQHPATTDEANAE